MMCCQLTCYRLTKVERRRGTYLETGESVPLENMRGDGVLLSHSGTFDESDDSEGDEALNIKIRENDWPLYKLQDEQ